MFRCCFLSVLLVLCTSTWTYGKGIKINYEKPDAYQYQPIYEVLRSHHQTMLGESAKFISSLYHLHDRISVVVTECGELSSRFEPDGQTIVICYQGLYAKVSDYPFEPESPEQFKKRVFQNVMFTFWHEVGHALMEQFDIAPHVSMIEKEVLADEFAVMSMLWRGGKPWRDVIAISGLHYKMKAEKGYNTYEFHLSDQARYENIYSLLYGFAPNDNHRIAREVSKISRSKAECQSLYLATTNKWENYLRENLKRAYF